MIITKKKNIKNFQQTNTMNKLMRPNNYLLIEKCILLENYETI